MTDSVQVPVLILISVGTAVSVGFGVLWRHILYLMRENKRLHELLLAEREERIKILESLRVEAERRASRGKPF
jgi:hypothetical protein